MLRIPVVSAALEDTLRVPIPQKLGKTKLGKPLETVPCLRRSTAPQQIAKSEEDHGSRENHRIPRYPRALDEPDAMPLSPRNPVNAHVGAEPFGNENGAVGLLVILHHGDPRPANSQTGSI